MKSKIKNMKTRELTQYDFDYTKRYVIGMLECAKRQRSKSKKKTLEVAATWIVAFMEDYASNKTLGTGNKSVFAGWSLRVELAKEGYKIWA
jgi:hypothetical protein